MSAGGSAAVAAGAATVGAVGAAAAPNASWSSRFFSEFRGVFF